MRVTATALVVVLSMTLAAAATVVPGTQQAAPGTPAWSYEVVACYPHDPGAFTQGLIVRDGFLYESTGLNGRSSLRRVRIESGEVVSRVNVARRYFAEGLAEHGGELFQLTWETGVAFVYDMRTLARRRTLRYKGEGWGLGSSGRELFMSDGSDTISFLDPASFAVLRRVAVHDGGRPVERLNELEWVQGRILANVWLTDRIAVIDPQTGTVDAWLDLSALGPPGREMTNAVLNGIAYDERASRLFVTGKLWPTLYEIRVLKAGEVGAGLTCP